MDVEQQDRFEALKASSFAQLLIRCARLINERGVALAREELEIPDLRPSHLLLLPHIPLDGIRQTELATALDVSKQAVGQMVGPLVDAGLLERVADPEDRRAKLVRFTEKGETYLFRGMGVLLQIEEPLHEALGAERAAQLRELLLALQDALEPG